MTTAGVPTVLFSLPFEPRQLEALGLATLIGLLMGLERERRPAAREGQVDEAGPPRWRLIAKCDRGRLIAEYDRGQLTLRRLSLIRASISGRPRLAALFC